MQRGAGELLLTSMDRDGTRDGFDLELTRAVSDAVDVPVIASGGVGTLDHLADGVLEGGADAVLAASIFHFGEHTIAEAKAAMAARGISFVRVPSGLVVMLAGSSSVTWRARRPLAGRSLSPRAACASSLALPSARRPASTSVLGRERCALRPGRGRGHDRGRAKRIEDESDRASVIQPE